MKKTIVLTLFLFISLNIFAQNGGQFNENNVIKIEYLGYIGTNHTFRLFNKQTCKARIRTKIDNETAIDIQIDSASNQYINVPRPHGSSVRFKAKSETSCPNFTNPDMGWVEIETMVTLNLVETNNVIIIRGADKLVLRLDNGIIKSSFGSRSYVEHIKIYTILGNVKFDDLIFVKRSNQIDLNNYLKSGLNIIEVIIVSDTSTDRFIFKYIKP